MSSSKNHSASEINPKHFENQSEVRRTRPEVFFADSSLAPINTIFNPPEGDSQTLANILDEIQNVLSANTLDMPKQASYIILKQGEAWEQSVIDLIMSWLKSHNNRLLTYVQIEGRKRLATYAFPLTIEALESLHEKFEQKSYDSPPY